MDRRGRPGLLRPAGLAPLGPVHLITTETGWTELSSRAEGG